MKRALSSVVLGLFAVISLLSPLMVFFPEKVSAAGETYTWKSQNVVTVTGGDVDPGQMQIATNNPNMLISVPPLKHSSGCSIRLTITLNGNNAGTISTTMPSPNAPPVLGNGDRFCDEWDHQNNRAAFPGVSASYNGKSVSIGGNRGGADEETEQQKNVSVIINSPKSSSDSQDSITIEIKDKDNKTIRTATVQKSATQGSDDPNDPNYVEPGFQPVAYVTDFKLEPGDYVVCATIVIADCEKFKKEKGKSLVLEYGESSVDRKVIVKIDVGYLGGTRNLTVGPLEVALRKPDGSQITMSTDTKEHKMTLEEESSQGGGTVEYRFTLTAVFDNVAPGPYEVCVEGIPDCKEITKQAGENEEVNFTLDWNAFDSENEHEKDCKDKYEVMGVRAITFVVCSFIDTGIYLVGSMDKVIVNLLTVDTKDIFDDSDSGNAFHTSWNSFRLIAIGIIVVVALIFIVSYAMGTQIMLARQVVPRALFAAVFIALSWDIMEFFANLSNDAGTGMRSLVYAPFKDLGNLGGEIGGGSLFVVTLVSTGAALAFGWIGLFSFVLTGVLASFTVLTVLIMRKIIVLLVILFAPVAIACSILPNTRKIYDFWNKTQIAVWIVFPMIMLIIAAGRVVSVVAFQAPGNQTINQLIAVIAYFSGYFLILWGVKFVGGTVATISGAIGNQTKNMSRSLSRYRSNTMRDNMSKMGRGQRFQGTNALARGFNATTFNATTAAKSNVKGVVMNPLNYVTAGGRRRVRASWSPAVQQQRALNTMRYGDSAGAKVVAHNDPLNQAQLYANEADARANLASDFGVTNEADIDKAIAAAKANGGFGRDQQINAFQNLMSSGTGFRNIQEMHAAINRVAGANDDIAAQLIGEGDFIARERTGRHDLAPGFEGHMKLRSSMRQNGALSNEEVDDAMISALKLTDIPRLMSDKPRSVQNLIGQRSDGRPSALHVAMERAKVRMNSTDVSPDDRRAAREEFGRLAGIAENIQARGLTYASPQNVRHADEGVITATRQLRDEVTQASSRVAIARDPQTGQWRAQTQVNPATGQPSPILNINHDEDIERGYNQQSPNRRN